MAIVAIGPQEIVPGGLAPVYTTGLLVAGTNQYTVSNDGLCFLHVKKTGAGACTVTIVTPGTFHGAAIADQTFNVPATTGDVMIPLDRGLYNDGNELVTVTFSEVTGLSCAALHLTPRQS